MKLAAEKTDQESLTVSQRWVGLATVGVMLLLLGFFAYHQLANTGLFTAAFGPAEMVSLYGPILVSFVAPVVRAWTARQNPGRPFEAATGLSLAIGSLWLLVVFPFDFSHLADVLPGTIRFLLSWVTNDIGQVPLILQVIVGPITALATILKYVSVRRRERAESSLQQPS